MAYLGILRRKGIAGLLVSTLVARLPVGINGLAVLLYVEAERDSFATAGVVTGALSLGGALGGPLQGRIVDRRGLRPLMLFAVLHVTALAAVWALTRGGAPTAVLSVTGFLGGASLPPATSVLRSRWSYLLGGEQSLIAAAYALDSVLIQAVFVTGPLFTAVAIASTGLEGALVLSGACALVGTAIATFLLLRQPGPEPDRTGSHLGLGALASRPIRTLVIASFPVGFHFGSVEVALPGYAEDVGRPALAGVLLAIFSIAGVVAGLLYGIHRFDAPLHVVHRRMAWLLPLAALPLLLASSDLVVALLVVVAGAPVAPLVASRNQLVASVSTEGTITEAFTWPLTAMIAGISAGAAVGGWLVEAGDWSAPVVAGAVMAGLGALFLQLRDNRLAPPAAAGASP
jgi:predicted MFS family arabinose efflux permease